MAAKKTSKKAPAKKAAPAKNSAAKPATSNKAPAKQEGGMADMKARFREALEKKNSNQHASAEGVEHDGSGKSHGANGPTQAPEFRRKSI